MEWKPATLEEVQEIIRRDLMACDEQQVETFRRYAVEPYCAPILRYGTLEVAIIVARKGSEAIYWEDVEEGFNISPVAPDGRILEHLCNQDELGHALNRWIDGRGHSEKVGPASPTQ